MLSNILNTDIKDLPGEIWKDLPGYNNRYSISNYSRVKSNIQNKIIKKSLSKGRYKVVLYLKGRKGKHEDCGRLCLKSFIRLPKENETVYYRDGNILNTHLDNMSWITRQDSARLSGISGECNGMAVLNNHKVLEIRKCHSYGEKIKELAYKHHVSIMSIYNIVSRKSWKNV